ncbi:MAG: 3-dehydroquinate synthase [Muribaculaceae bacterium]|nr:3-dehydroquinate synthase [Muribaculaceae bacterium]
MQKIVYATDPADALTRLVSEMAPQSVHIVTDSTVKSLILDPMALCDAWSVTVIPDGEEHKSIESVTRIWHDLVEHGATRHSLVVNIGGGVITDMGGFTAATYKRGVRFVNLPTTLLAAVDAAVGGKTGINFDGLKNEVGAFREADAVVISTSPLLSLPQSELLSGYAEMLKHAFLMGPEAVGELTGYDLSEFDQPKLLELLKRNVGFKQSVVMEDPTERGLRRILNFGHTAGHAFESLAIEKNHPMPHGYAVAQGMVVELILSHMIMGMPTEWINRYVAYLREAGYAFPAVTCDDYPRLLALMAHDKKNSSPEAVNFTLLSAPGQPKIDFVVPPAEIRTALDISRDYLGM